MRAEPLRNGPDQSDMLIELVQLLQRPVTSGLEVSQAELVGQSIDVAAEHRLLLRRARPASQHEASRPRGHCHRPSELAGFGRRRDRGSTPEEPHDELTAPERTPHAGSDARGGTHPRATGDRVDAPVQAPRPHLIRFSAAIGHRSGRSGCVERGLASERRVRTFGQLRPHSRVVGRRADQAVQRSTRAAAQPNRTVLDAPSTCVFPSRWRAAVTRQLRCRRYFGPRPPGALRPKCALTPALSRVWSARRETIDAVGPRGLAPPLPVRLTHTTQRRRVAPSPGTARATYGSSRGLHKPHVDRVSESSGELVVSALTGRQAAWSRPPIFVRDAITSVLAPSYCSAESLSWRRRSASAQLSASTTCFQTLSDFQWVRSTS